MHHGKHLGRVVVSLPVKPPKGGSGEGDVVFPPVKPPKGGSGEEEMLPQVIPPSMQETLGNITLDITLGYIQP